MQTIDTRKVVFASALIALASGLEIFKSLAGFTLLAGFEPVTFFVVLSGILLGARYGFLCGFLTKIIFSMYLGFYPTILIDSIAFGLMGLVSGALSGFFMGLANKKLFIQQAVFGIYGLFMSFAFNLMSNAGWALFVCWSAKDMSQNCLYTIIGIGLVFNTRNFVWNTIIFAALMPAVLNFLKDFKNGKGGSTSKVQ